MNWKETIEKTGRYLEAKGVDEPVTAAELLAARLLKSPRGSLVSFLDRQVPEKYLEALRRAMARLVKGEPLQYVLGEWDFRSLTLGCDRRALIPRPETEELVTRVIAYLKSKFGDGRSLTGEPPLVVDIGTGTGAIILSLAKEFKGPAYLGTDVSEEAITLAKENAERTGLSEAVKFAVMDGLEDFDEPECIDVVVSNPPYIKTAVCETLDRRVKDFEPRLALDGGAEGLDLYEKYLESAINLLKPGGAVFFEIGEDQGEALKKLLADYGFGEIRIEKDFAGHDRYAMATLA